MTARAWLLAAALGVALGHSAALASEPIDLNTAPAAALQGLPGIGPKKAEAIIALRGRRPFTRVTQLLEVRGIGKKTLERLKELVFVGPAPVSAPAASRAAKVAAPNEMAPLAGPGRPAAVASATGL